MIDTWITHAAAFVFAILFVRNQIETDKRVRAVKNQLGRLSLTFLKIENDINAVQNSLIVLAADDDAKKQALIKLRDRRKRQFQAIVEEGTNAAEIMRGLEEPDIGDDPNYWSDRRGESFGFDKKD